MRVVVVWKEPESSFHKFNVNGAAWEKHVL